MEMKFYGHSFKELLLEVLKDTRVVEESLDSSKFQFFFHKNNFVAESKADAVRISRRNSSADPSFEDGMNHSDKIDEFIYRSQHHHLFDLMRHLYHFFIHVGRYQSITICPNQVSLKINYSLQETTIKDSPHAKRVSSSMDLDELKHLLMTYKGGYVINRNEGSVSIANRKKFVIQGYGFDFDQTQSVRKALLEYLERWAATYELAGTVLGSYEDLSGAGAMNPALFGLYDEVNESGQLSLARYDSKLVMHWVKAKSLLNDAEYYVPEQLSQYLKDELFNRYVYESSNGCAIGNSLVEASFYSILEVIERDLFMKCWFYQQPLKKIQFKGACELLVGGKQLYLEELGYSLAFYYMDNPMRIPAIWCLITSQDDKNPFYSVTGLGCHLHLQDAVAASFFEAYKSFKDIREQDCAKLRMKIKKIEQSQQIDDVIEHVHYFLSYQSKTLIENITAAAEPINFAELASHSYEDRDLVKELDELLRRIRCHYSDVLIINQGNPFLQAFGLSCTKALLAGAVPLDFTSHYIRQFAGDPDQIKKTQRNIHPLA